MHSVIQASIFIITLAYTGDKLGCDTRVRNCVENEWGAMQQFTSITAIINTSCKSKTLHCRMLCMSQIKYFVHQ